MSGAPTAAWPVDTLVGSLARAGWGPLAEESQGCRTVLRALVDVLPHRSASGLSTAEQLARVCGLTERWIRACLTRLESLGLITWTRGRRHVASGFRVCKRTLTAWITGARKPDAEFLAELVEARRNRPPRDPSRRRFSAGTHFRPFPPEGGGNAGTSPAVVHNPSKEPTVTPEERAIITATYGQPPAGRQWTDTCDVCSRTRERCESIPEAKSGHRYTPGTRKEMAA